MARGSYLHAGIHGVAAKVGLSAVAWFLAIMWLNLGGGAQLDVILYIALGLFVMFLTLILLTATMLINDPRLSQPSGSCSLLHCRH